MPERRLRELGGGVVLPLSVFPWAWASSLSPVVVLAGRHVLSSRRLRGGGGRGLRTKVLPDLVGADNGDARGRRFPPWGRCRGDLTPLCPSFRGESPNLGLPDWMTAASIDVVTSLEASFFGMLGAMLGMLVLLVGSTLSGSVGVRVPLACFGLPRATKLERPTRSLSALTSFPRTSTNQVVIELAVAVVLVSSGGAPDLVELGSVAMCVVFVAFP